MKEKQVTLEYVGKDSNIAVVRLNRPDEQNRTDCTTFAQRCEVYKEIIKNQEIRVVIKTGTGNYFETGGQLNASDAEERARYTELITQDLHLDEQIEVPVISAVNGVCIAGGMTTLMKSDLAIAADNAVFGYPEIQRGGFPMMAMVEAMPFISQKALLEAFYTGKFYDVNWAEKNGIINHIVNKDNLMEAAVELAETIAAYPSSLIRIGRRTYFDMVNIPLGDRREYAKGALRRLLVEQAKYQKE